MIPLDLAKRKGRDLVLEFGQLFDKIPRDQIRAGGKRLAELDVGGPQLFEGHTDPFGRCRCSTRSRRLREIICRPISMY